MAFLAGINMKATFFNRLDLSNLTFVPVYEPKDRSPTVLSRGSIRYQSTGNPLTFTGPKLRVIYGGCRWNKIVFGDENGEFHDFIFNLSNMLKETIWANPEKYRRGSKNANRFTLEENFIKSSSDPMLYPDEFRCRLATLREWVKDADDPSKVVLANESCATTFFTDDQTTVDPSEIQNGGEMYPVIQASYYRENEKFGLVFTVLQGHYFPPVKREVEKESWEIDYDVMDESSN